jgi:hypothetical protein
MGIKVHDVPFQCSPTGPPPPEAVPARILELGERRRILPASML